MSKTIKALFLGLFFVSGACGLIYEIAWSRLLVFVFGGTTFAVTTVLGCFMGGLGLGSFIAAKLDKKIKRPERTYGILEICIGLYCIFIPFLFKLTLPVYQSMVNTFGESFLVLTVVRIIICVAILIVPTTCMGATLPVLCKALTRRSGHRGRSIALLYGINTLGAFIGCVLAGFMLLPMAGLTMSIWIAALLNVAAGVIALVMSKKTAPVEDGLKLPEEQSKKESTKQSKKQLQLTKGVRHPRLVLWLFALSGFAAMAYQVAWIRSLILSMGASTYSFTAIVACFILGLAVGSLVISSFIDRLKHPLMVAGILELVIAVSALVVVPAFGDMHRFVASFVSVEGITFSGILIKELIYVFGLLIVPTVCMGALMPLVMKIYNPGQTARSVGHVYAANTWGTITGSFCAGFLLIPHELIGMQSTIIIASAASGIIGILFISMDTKKQKLPAWITTGVLTASCLFLMASTPQWSKAAMISGPYLGIKKELHDESEILFYKEGIDTTVAVTGDKTHRSLLVNGKADASNHYSDMVTQSLLGYIPMFLAPNAKEVCVIGLGAGVTVKSVLDFDIDSVDVVEISEAVKEASVLFEPLIGKPLADKRTTYHRNDGRNYLAVTDKTFDVIISEPSNPWISGIANLFSQEFFRLAKESLKPGGLHCQWVQSYSMEYDNFGAIINTMASVFEYVNCWEASTGDYLVIGSDKPIALDVENLYFQFAGKSIRNMLAQMKISDPMQIANHYVADRTQLKPLMEGKKILADDIPHLEFSAPISLLSENDVEIKRTINECRGPITLKGDPNSVLNKRFSGIVNQGRKRHYYYNELMLNDTLRKDTARYHDYLINMLKLGTSDARLLNVAIILLPLPVDNSPEALKLESSRLKAIAEISSFLPDFPKFVKRYKGEDPAIYWPFSLNANIPRTPAADILNDKMRAAKARNDLKEALKQAQAILDIQPFHYNTLYNAGLFCLRLDGYGVKPGGDYLLQAWILNQKDADLNFLLARLYSVKKEGQKALYFLESAAKNGYKSQTPLKDNPNFNHIKADDRFIHLGKQIDVE